MYIYKNSEWVKTDQSRKNVEESKNLLKNVTSNENFADETRASEKTMSGRSIMIDGKDDFSVTHVFCAGTGIPLNNLEEYLMFSYLIKNTIKIGTIYIGVMFLELEEFPSVEVPYSIYEPATLLTPDDLNDLTKIEQKIKIPHKTDFIEVVADSAAPEDTTLKWLDTTINLPKQYNEETTQWELLDTTMSLYEKTSRKVWTYRQLLGSYYETPVNFDEMQIKTFLPVFTFYPGLSIYTGDTEPTPQKGLYWNNQTTDLVKRAKYNDTGFVEWETLPISSSLLPSGAELGLPQIPYIVPLQGFYEVADIKLQYNTVATPWTQYPGEVYGKNYKMDEDGFSVQSGQNVMYIDEDEILAQYKGLNIFGINGDKFFGKKMELEESIKIGDYFLKQQLINGKNMLLLY